MTPVNQPGNDSGGSIDFGVKTVTIYACAAIGGFIAALADVVQKEEASAISKLTSLSARHLAITMQPYWILAALIMLAVLLCFVFQPNDRKQSFIVGMGIIAAIMTVTPYKQPSTGTVVAPVVTPAATGGGIEDEVRLASNSDFSPLDLPSLPAAEPSALPTFELAVSNRSSVPADVAVSVFANSSSQEFFQKASLLPGLSTRFVFDLTAMSGGRVQYAIEIDGRRMPPQLVTENAGPSDVYATLKIEHDLIRSENSTSTTYTAPASVFLREDPNGGGLFGGNNEFLRKLNGSFKW